MSTLAPSLAPNSEQAPARPATTEKACCHARQESVSAEACTHHGSGHAAHSAHAHHAAAASWKAAASVTLHCLTGCAIGEWLGLAVGATLGWTAAATITLAVTLAFVFGFGLTLAPLMKTGLRFAQAMKIVWIGELVSISVMELVMNLVDYNMGGMQQGMSLLHPQYWIAFGTAAVAGYLAAVPVNYWLLRRNLKNCH